MDPNHPQQAPPLAAPRSPPTGGGAGYDCTTTKRISTVAVLPEDILVDILSRLPLKLLFRYKCVCRAWLGLIAACCLSRIAPTLQGFFYGTGGTEAHAYGGFLDLLGTSAAAPPVDPSFSFLTAKLLPETAADTISLMDSCNGLVLFRNRRRRCSSGARADMTDLGYIVCNPVTKEWVPVPTTGGEDDDGVVTVAYIIFHPAVSPSRFQLVQFSLDHSGKDVLQVHAYSSDSREWTARSVQCWSNQTIMTWMTTFVNGMLHLSVSLRGERHRNVIVAVDGEGRRRRVIGWPQEERGSLVFLGQSQGLLHCVSGRRDQYADMAEVSISALKDYDDGEAETQQWILKGRVSRSQLFGQGQYWWCLSHSTVAIHPDQNLVFFYHLLRRRLVSYDMDCEEMSDLCTLMTPLFPATPYFPYFGECSALANKHRHC